MATAEVPQIAILMALYEPRMDWLAEQLNSLNAQTYPNLRLYIRDDCSAATPFDQIEALVHKCITAFPVQIARNERNLGSNGTFEALTREAEGDLFAYCDQDDVWLADKLETLSALLLSSPRAGLVCCDVSIIDAEGTLRYAHMGELRPRHRFLQGEKLYRELIYHNFVIGCAMLIRSEIAKAALPFADSLVHDHYLAFCCSVEHEILFCPRPLVLYRQHGGNQTGVLAKVTDKKSYNEKYIKAFSERVRELSARFDLPDLQEAAAWAEARERNAAGELSGALRLWKLRKTDPRTSLFDLLALHMPEAIFAFAINTIRHRR